MNPRRVIYSVAMSVDGYIAGPNGEADWIVMDPDIDFRSMLSRYDTVLMGRKSFEAAKKMGGGGSMPGAKAYVFSRTLQQRDCKGVTVSATPAETIAAIKAAPGKDLWLFGGGSLFQSLLSLGLVDAVEIGVIPVLLGGGVPLLAPSSSRAHLTLTGHRVYPKTGTVMVEYAVTPRP
jgi:dihydrofolate reductase